MNVKSNVIGRSSKTQGLLFGFLGVLAFSFTIPLTRVAVAGLDPAFVGLGRALVAAALEPGNAPATDISQVFYVLALREGEVALDAPARELSVGRLREMLE